MKTLILALAIAVMSTSVMAQTKPAAKATAKKSCCAVKTAAAKKRKVLHKKPKKIDPSSISTSVVPAKEPERKEESEAETLPVFWPIITEQFNFDPLFEVDAVEDELQLGPLKA